MHCWYNWFWILFYLALPNYSQSKVTWSWSFQSFVSSNHLKDVTKIKLCHQHHDVSYIISTSHRFLWNPPLILNFRLSRILWRVYNSETFLLHRNYCFGRFERKKSHWRDFNLFHFVERLNKVAKIIYEDAYHAIGWQLSLILRFDF